MRWPPPPPLFIIAHKRGREEPLAGQAAKEKLPLIMTSPLPSLSRNADGDRSRKKKKPPSQKAAPLKSTIIDFCHRGEFCLLRRPRLLCYPSYSPPPARKSDDDEVVVEKSEF